MKIILDKEYFIVDGYGNSVVLMKDMFRTTKRVDKATGEETDIDVQTPIAYYSTVQEAVLKYIKIRTHDGLTDTSINLKEFIERYESVKDEVLKTVKG